MKKRAIQARAPKPKRRIVAGLGFILLGLLGLLLPILPGWPFLFYGLELLGLGFLIPAAVRTRLHTAVAKAMFWRKPVKVDARL